MNTDAPFPQDHSADMLNDMMPDRRDTTSTPRTEKVQDMRVNFFTAPIASVDTMQPRPTGRRGWYIPGASGQC